MSRLRPPFTASLLTPSRSCLFCGPTIWKPRALAESSSFSLSSSLLQTTSISLVESLRPSSSIAAPPMSRASTLCSRTLPSCSNSSFTSSRLEMRLELDVIEIRPVLDILQSWIASDPFALQHCFQILHHGMIDVHQFIFVLQIEQYAKELLGEFSMPSPGSGRRPPGWTAPSWAGCSNYLAGPARFRNHHRRKRR